MNNPGYASVRPVYSGGNEVVPLRGSAALFPAMHEAIAGARSEVWIVTYIFSRDPSAWALAQALAQAAQRGVQVRVVVDGFGAADAVTALRELLEPAGASLAVFRPLVSWRAWLQPIQLRRLHQKLCVVDGEIAFVGGINLIDDHYDPRHGWDAAPRLDYAVRLRGPVVEPVAQTARAMWTRATLGTDWRDEVRSIVRDPQPIEATRDVLRKLRIVAPARPQSAAQQLESLPAVRAAFVVRDNVRQRRTIELAYIQALHQAREQVDLVSPYFYPGRHFRRALGDAAKRGVKVRLLLQGKADLRIAAIAARAVYEEMLANGVRIYEYQPAFMHAKVALVDRYWATVGSSNIDPLSLLLNLEANVIVRDRGFVDLLRRQLEQDFAAALEFSPQQRSESSLLRRARQVCVAWMARAYLRVAGVTGRY